MSNFVTPLQDCPTVSSYVERIGATFRTLFTATITEQGMGYEKEITKVTFKRDGQVKSALGYAPTPLEAANIEKEILSVNFPDQVTLSELPNGSLPPLILNAHSNDLFVFRNKSKQIEFIQVRIDLPDGDKRYVPQTYWSDGEWRAIEPEDGLPLFGIDKVQSGDRVFLHEGAKAARAAQDISDDPSHPWYDFLSSGKHVGWCGGSHYYFKNKWHELGNMPSEVIIVPDNDFIGSTAVKKISHKVRCSCRVLILDSQWARGWDLADPFPDSFIKDGLYVGPRFEEMLDDCNWATEPYFIEDKLKYKIRDQFAQNWIRVNQLKRYVSIACPEVSHDKDQFNNSVRPYSDVADTAALLHTVSATPCQSMTFNPALPCGLVREDGIIKMNQYVDRRIRARQGDAKPFYDFIDYLIPDSIERKELMRWMATLYARPEVRMKYAILLLSKLQGVGKSTLFRIMTKLIGPAHVSTPTDSTIQSDFNSWLFNKRLITIHEIYAGQNWKVYNKLKTYITDERVMANEKHMANYELPLVAHFVAASNSMEALRVDSQDRRWFVPKLPTTLFDSYVEINEWIERGGVSFLARDLLDWDDYVEQNEIAPLTGAKLELVDQSMPADERIVLMMMGQLISGQCLTVDDLWLWLQSDFKKNTFTPPARIVELAREKKFYVHDQDGISSIWTSEKDFRSASDDVGYQKAVIKSKQVPSEVINGNQLM